MLYWIGGSGSLGVACQKLNRQYILIEKNIDYCKLIEKRLSQEYMKL
jgi:DNA modification methylase